MKLKAQTNILRLYIDLINVYTTLCSASYLKQTSKYYIENQYMPHHILGFARHTYPQSLQQFSLSNEHTPKHVILK